MKLKEALITFTFIVVFLFLGMMLGEAGRQFVRAQQPQLGGIYVFAVQGFKPGLQPQAISGRIFVDAGTTVAYGTNLPQHAVTGTVSTGDSSPSNPSKPDGGFLREMPDHSLLLILNDNRVFVVRLAEKADGSYQQGVVQQEGVVQQVGPLGWTGTGQILKSVE